MTTIRPATVSTRQNCSPPSRSTIDDRARAPPRPRTADGALLGRAREARPLPAGTAGPLAAGEPQLHVHPGALGSRAGRRTGPAAPGSSTRRCSTTSTTSSGLPGLRLRRPADDRRRARDLRARAGCRPTNSSPTASPTPRRRTPADRIPSGSRSSSASASLSAAARCASPRRCGRAARASRPARRACASGRRARGSPRDTSAPCPTALALAQACPARRAASRPGCARRASARPSRAARVASGGRHCA